MDIVQLYRDYHIPHQTEGHKHCRPGWVNSECPFCTGNAGLHLGVTLNGDRFFCWRCGWHPPKKVLSKLLGVSNEYELYEILKNYKGRSLFKTEEKRQSIRIKGFKLPTNTTPLQKQHIQYLTSRGFDPDILQKDWGLLGTGPFSLLDKINYSHRILAPVYWDNHRVSFQARDITNKHTLKYMACPMDREIIHHKHVLYGRPDKWKDIGICVEGITDVWKLGFNAFATFGIKTKLKQVQHMAKLFKRIFVVYDDDPQAVTEAKKLVAELKFRGVDAIKIDIQGDPGSLTQDDANHLVNSLI